MDTIRQKDDPVLRKRAKEVLLKEIPTAKIRGVIRDLKKALKPQEDGVAIAAPQIGVSLRIFLVSGKVLARENSPEEKAPPDLVFINPEITKLSRKKRAMHEGCLSVRWRYGMVERHEKATVLAYSEQGKKFTYGGSGLMAQIFQHEIDHLDGALFIDKATEVEDIPPEMVKDPAWQKGRKR